MHKTDNLNMSGKLDIGTPNTAGVIKTVPSVYTLQSTLFIYTSQYTGSCLNLFQCTLENDRDNARNLDVFLQEKQKKLFVF